MALTSFSVPKVSVLVTTRARCRHRRRCVSLSPGGKGELCGLVNWAICQSRQDRVQVVADGYVESAASFNDRHNRCNSGASLLAADVDPVRLPVHELSAINRHCLRFKYRATCTLSQRATIFLATRPDNGRNRPGYIDVEPNSPAKRARFFLFAQCRCLEEFVIWFTACLFLYARV
jgi:hypothetical protein